VVFILVRLLESHPAVVGTARKIQPLHLLHCPQPFLVPLLKQNGFMFLHRLVIPLRSYLFFQFRSRLVYKIEWPILLRPLSFQSSSTPSPRFDCFPRMLSRVCKPCIWEELKRRAFGFLHPVLVLQLLLLIRFYNINLNIFFYLENRLYICPISSGGGTNQDVCRPTRPQTLSSRPICLTLWPQLFRWYPEIEEIEFLPGTHETKI
jgi:hypothetical protein